MKIYVRKWMYVCVIVKVLRLVGSFSFIDVRYEKSFHICEWKLSKKVLVMPFNRFSWENRIKDAYLRLKTLFHVLVFFYISLSNVLFILFASQNAPIKFHKETWSKTREQLIKLTFRFFYYYFYEPKKIREFSAITENVYIVYHDRQIRPLKRRGFNFYRIFIFFFASKVSSFVSFAPLLRRITTKVEIHPESSTFGAFTDWRIRSPLSDVYIYQNDFHARDST